MMFSWLVKATSWLPITSVVLSDVSAGRCGADEGLGVGSRAGGIRRSSRRRVRLQLELGHNSWGSTVR